MWCEKLLEIIVKEKRLCIKIQCDSSANAQLSKWLRYLADNWSLYTRHRARRTTISLPRQKMIKIILEIPQFSHAKNLFVATKRLGKGKWDRNTNEICFYTYDHLLDIFLNIRVSRIWTNESPKYRNRICIGHEKNLFNIPKKWSKAWKKRK